MIFKEKLNKKIAAGLLVVFLVNLFTPTSVWALTSGPGSPEFSSFEPVATTDMVSPFTGEFTYNLPVLNVPGPEGSDYALSLSYHSGVSSEEEASWVGFGWTLNPGAVNRGMRGFPDDYKNADVNQYNKTKPNWTSSVTEDLKLEFYSKDEKKEPSKGADNPNKDTTVVTRSPKLNLGISHTLRFNNYSGYFATTGFDMGFKGMGSVHLNRSADGVTFGLNISPWQILNAIRGKSNKEEWKGSPQKKAEGKKTKFDWKKSKEAMTKKVTNALTGSLGKMSFASAYGIASYSEFNSNVAVSKYNGKSFNLTLNAKVDALPQFGFEVGGSGNYNIQVNDPVLNGKANGFMYNPKRTDYPAKFDNSNVLSDYYVEKANPYDVRDINLGMPFNNADNFVVSGEGLGGGFRLYPHHAGHFYPTFVKSDQTIVNLAFEGTFGNGGTGPEIGVGFDFGAGWHTAAIGDWKDPKISDDLLKSFLTINYPTTNGWESASATDLQNFIDGIATSSDESEAQFDSDCFFRFNGDMGGELVYSANTDAVAATPFNFLPAQMPGTKKFFANVKDLGLQENTLQKAGATSYIQHNKFPIDAAARFENDPEIVALFNSTSTDFTDLIGELKVKNEAGISHIYGLPVFTGDETNIQVGLTGGENVNNYLYYPPVGEPVDINTPWKNKIVTGEKRLKKYATAYLLTQINTPDYVNIIDPDDAKTKGADESDFGGWTKFGYRKAAYMQAATPGIYRYRTPYTGTMYQKGSISYDGDDMGSVSTGTKETYYLKAIETKTHIAFFVTNKTQGTEFDAYLASLTSTQKAALNTYLNGSGKIRPDGLDAKALEADGTDLASTGKNQKGSNHLEMLERIVLYSKDRMDVPLQTINFEYDNSLVRNLPNSDFGNYPSNAGANYNKSGKLTLKRVWFESEGTVGAKISPYQFNYTYRTSFPVKYAGDMAAYTNFSAADQNPDYKPEEMDMWGNYQFNGEDRHDKMKPWVAQTANDQHFDAGAWQLKQIILPSGGEINVQYEQHDYAYVQDRNAMAMVSLLSDAAGEDHNGYKPQDTKYYINTADIGIAPTDLTKMTALTNALKDFFVDNDKESKPKIFFKYLFALQGSNADLNCKSEYIDGYTTVNDVGIETSGSTSKIYFSLGTVNHKFLSNNPNRRNVPRQVAYEYYSATRNGFMDGGCTSELKEFDDNAMDLYDQSITAESDEGTKYTIDNDPPPSGDKFKKAVTRPVFKKLLGKLNDPDYFVPKKDDVGKAINYGLSYLRLPLLTTDKKGGGVRVKRILMYDNGISSDNGDQNLYGSEYEYKSENGRSSGVAVNEPSAGREENALVTFLPRLKQSMLKRIISGKDKEQSEGPIGESVLPGPSVGYSRVKVKNIHKGKTGSGYKVFEFFTAKDYPYDKDYQTADVTGAGVEYTDLKDTKKSDWLNLPLGLVNISVKKRWATQGYRFIINSMHGQPKVTSTYGENDFLSARTTYNYFEPGDKIPMLRYDKTNDKYITFMGNPGKEEDLTMEIQSVKDEGFDFSLELDISVVISVAPAVYFSMFPSFSYSENELNTHVTTKVLRYPVVLKSQTNYVDGVTSISESVAFDANTGKSILTRTTDGYDQLKLQQDAAANHNGSIYAFNIPAPWVYPQLGQKAQDVTNTNQLSLSAGNVTTYGKNPLDLISGQTNEYTLGNSNVLASSVQTFSNNLYTDATALASVFADYGVDNANTTTMSDLNNIWRPTESYVYKSDLTKANYVTPTDPERIYNGGLFTTFAPFNFANATANDYTKWIKASTVTKYSPNGNALEERDVLGIYSAAKYGYRNTLPVAVGKNCRYDELFFEDFENASATSSLESHSGKRCLNLTGNSSYKFIKSSQGIKLTSHLQQEGALLKVWVKSHFPDGISENTAPSFKAVINGGLQVPFLKVASVGEWTLYEAKIKQWSGIALNSTLDVGFSYAVNNALGEQVYLDDIRFQPLEAAATCNVYDIATRKLVAQFDDQHFGMYYQYNDQGKLVRKLVETEKGLKTIQETQYNTPRVPKNL